ncbi:MAG: hypothetical protein LAT81_14235, partial [Oceanicaulis sp.]|nr:hypothetical protein [Oceanicaulis sp.]
DTSMILLPVKALREIAIELHERDSLFAQSTLMRQQLQNYAALAQAQQEQLESYSALDQLHTTNTLELIERNKALAKENRELRYWRNGLLILLILQGFLVVI